ITIVDEELAAVQELKAKGLVTLSRLSELERSRTELEGLVGQVSAEMARARASIAETELKIVQCDRDRQAEIATDRRDATTTLAELRERAAAGRDQLSRMEIRAPVAGTVTELAAHTVGGVVAAGETIALVVPDEGSLVVEAHIRPSDVSHLHAGQSA